MAIWNWTLNYELIREWKNVILGTLTYTSQHLCVGSEENHEISRRNLISGHISKKGVAKYKAELTTLH
jgi:hypothetical protein